MKQWLLILCWPWLPCAWVYGARPWAYTAEIITAKGTKMSRDGEIVIFDRPSEQEQAKASFKVQPKFQADPKNGYVESKLERQYFWKAEGDVSIKNAKSQIATCTTTEKTWGKDFKIKAKVNSIIVNEKRENASAEATKKAVAPLIKIKSASFSELAGGNGFIILEQFRGKPVSTPEFVRDDEKKDDKKSPVGFYANRKPVYQVQFEVKPASLASITAKCEDGFFETNEKMFMVNGAGEAEDKVEGSQVIERICRSGPESGEKMKWSFSVYGGVQLSCKDEMEINKYYVLLHQGNGDKPWKNLLKAAFEKWGISGAHENDELINNLGRGISGSSSYNHDGWNPKEGKRHSLYTDQQKSPMPLSVSKMVNAFCSGDARIICVEAAGLMKYAANVLGSGGVTSRGINWKETGLVRNPETNQMEEKSWSNGHGYCLFGGHVHDPVPGGGGPTGMSEENYINQNLRKDERSDFKNLRNLNFQFNE